MWPGAYKRGWIKKFVKFYERNKTINYSIKLVQTLVKQNETCSNMSLNFCLTIKVSCKHFCIGYCSVQILFQEAHFRTMQSRYFEVRANFKFMAKLYWKLFGQSLRDFWSKETAACKWIQRFKEGRDDVVGQGYKDLSCSEYY